MNRRGLLKGILGIGTVGVAGRAAAEPAKNDEKYWEAQRHIDELYNQQHEFAGFFEQGNLQLHTGKGAYMEITQRGDEIVMVNPKTGGEITL